MSNLSVNSCGPTNERLLTFLNVCWSLHLPIASYHQHPPHPAYVGAFRTVPHNQSKVVNISTQVLCTCPSSALLQLFPHPIISSQHEFFQDNLHKFKDKTRCSMQMPVKRQLGRVHLYQSPAQEGHFTMRAYHPEDQNLEKRIQTNRA